MLNTPKPVEVEAAGNKALPRRLTLEIKTQNSDEQLLEISLMDDYFCRSYPCVKCPVFELKPGLLKS